MASLRRRYLCQSRVQPFALHDQFGAQLLRLLPDRFQIDGLADLDHTDHRHHQMRRAIIEIDTFLLDGNGEGLIELAFPGRYPSGTA